MSTRRITEHDVPALALGCALLGTGGGGGVEPEVLATTRALREHGPVPVVTLADLADDDLILPLSAIGAPTVAAELLPSGAEAGAIRRVVEARYGRAVAAVMATEIGGANGVAPVGWAAGLGLPLLDADGMGRAFPELQMVSMNVAQIPPSAVVLADTVGNVATLDTVDADWAEQWARALCVASGSSAVLADFVMTAAQARTGVIAGSVSRALRLGTLLREAADPLPALIAELGAAHLVTGKVAAVARRTEGGFVHGTATVRGTGPYTGTEVVLDLQNENLRARQDGRVLAVVPDLIAVVDAYTGVAVATESLRYGQRVAVLSWACDPIWRTPRGLALAGPAAFGTDLGAADAS
ncbi:hypothetical protein Cs7R123_47470 [Catellatospora sp. TT07R-123]|uniref:DUF917 domain-containing protein n=1 Tax=Catellatospora sp. TT07R-123 TaxID=2733863 RepID=UPI001B1C527E|nr:DUF917 domain-containing protein [Catellatospora sp. TT07R-123]GHJ47405.1 hypothetical protein Cs7R123_47470 [Catellatospora sp. TT07R-123]